MHKLATKLKKKQLLLEQLPVESLPASWYKAIGMLKSKSKALQKHVRTVRKEWDRK